MRNKWIKRFFPLLAVLLLTPWPVAYAYDVSDGVIGEDTVRIEVAELSAAPSGTAFGKAIGGVRPGDLFYIDATDNPADIQVTLYITNTQQLSCCLRYLIFKVGVYVESNTGKWEKASMGNGEPIPDTVITLHNGQASFIVPGLAKYKVTIDSGSFYCTTTNTDRGSVSPQFYLEVD